ncbi:MAG TPA: DUF929 family protein [Candidatus Saccharimonadia bacterium]|nr:DUF929 family protein [Candidatus Saccharimonadia bacterium]
MQTDNKLNLKRPLIIVGAIVVLFIIFLIVKSPTTNNPNAPDTVASSSLLNKLYSIPTSVLNKVGSGTSSQKPEPISGQPLQTSTGLPKVLYMGAEYCPYCATERWAMVISLSRFGTFSNLKLTHSSTTDVYPDTQTFSFYGSSFNSTYFSFDPIELYSNIPSGSGYTVLQKPTSLQQSLQNTYDAPPYVSSSDQGAIPFIYFAGKYLIVGATYSPQLLQGETYDQIAASLDNPSNPIAKGMLGAANNISAALCKLTNNKPLTACTTTIQNLETKL